MNYLKEFCRFCLSFDENFHNMSSGDILEKANCCIGDFEFYCNFPNLICTKCLEALDGFFNFRNRCLQSELILQRYIQILTRNKLPNDFVNKQLAIFVSANFGKQCMPKNVQKVGSVQRVQSEKDTSQNIANTTDNNVACANTILPVDDFNDFELDLLQIDTEFIYNDIQIKEEQISEIDEIHVIDDENVLEVSPIVEACGDQETLSEPILSFNNQNINDKGVSNISEASTLRNLLENNTPLPLKVVKVSDSITHFLSKRKLDCTDQSEKRIKTVDPNLPEINRPNTPPDEVLLRKRETFQDSFIETTKVKCLPAPSQIPIFKSRCLPAKPLLKHKRAKVSRKPLCISKSQLIPQLNGARSTVTDFESGIALHCILNIQNDTNETLKKNDNPQPDNNETLKRNVNRQLDKNEILKRNFNCPLGRNETLKSNVNCQLGLNETLKKNDNLTPLTLKKLNQKVGFKFVSLIKPCANFVPINSNKETTVGKTRTYPPSKKLEVVINKEHNYSAISCGESQKTVELSNEHKGYCMTKSTNVTPPRMIIVNARDWEQLQDGGREQNVYLQELQPSCASFIGPLPLVPQNVTIIANGDTSHALQSNVIHTAVPPPLYPFGGNGCGLY